MKNAYTLPLCVLLVFTLSACVQKQARVVYLSNILSQEEILQHKSATGKNTIKGSALIRQSGGGVVTCAGNQITLTPMTNYAKERLINIYGNASRGFAHIQKEQIHFEPNLPEYIEMRRESQCDAQGYFKFDNVPDGDFFVATSIVWGVPVTQYQSELQGGVLMQAVSVQGGETKEIVLAP